MRGGYRTVAGGAVVVVTVVVVVVVAESVVVVVVVVVVVLMRRPYLDAPVRRPHLGARWVRPRGPIPPQPDLDGNVQRKIIRAVEDKCMVMWQDMPQLAKKLDMVIEDYEVEPLPGPWKMRVL